MSALTNLHKSSSPFIIFDCKDVIHIKACGISHDHLTLGFIASHDIFGDSLCVPIMHVVMATGYRSFHCLSIVSRFSFSHVHVCSTTQERTGPIELKFLIQCFILTNNIKMFNYACLLYISHCNEI